MVALTQTEEAAGLARYLGYLSPSALKTRSSKERPDFHNSEPEPQEPVNVWASEAAPEQDSAAFDIADELEKGLVEDEGFRAKNIRHPPSPNSGFERCSIIYQEATDEFHLMSADLDLLLVAKRVAQERRVEFSCPSEAQQILSPTARSDRKRPAFAMAYGEDADDWSLLQCKCERCAHRPRHLTCEYVGKGQQVARIQHSRRPVENANGQVQARVHHVSVHVPPVLRDNESAVWCPIWTGKDLGSRSTPNSPSSRGSGGGSQSPRRRRPELSLNELLPGAEDEPLQFQTRLPIWDPEVESLVLNFQGRPNLCSSPRNFMLETVSGQERKVILQHAQISKNTWCLDFMYPLSVVQAFAIAMSSVDWD